VDRQHPGSDLAAETAAAFAAGSILFAESDPTYAATLLDNARALYTFADTYRGKYSDAIPDAQTFYNSWSGYDDELIWGAIWLYRASGEDAYLQEAIAAYPAISGRFDWSLSWDDKSYGCYVLLAMLDGRAVYKDDTERWLDFWAGTSPGVPRTPGGLAFLSSWAPLRYAANTAFCALVYADRVQDTNGRYEQFANEQLHYMLGQNPANRSYLCGFGNNPPQNPHHRNAHASSSNDINVPIQNSHTLYGALVGGPDINDQYPDDRNQPNHSEVALDYNAAFSGVLARLYLDFGGYTLSDITSTNSTPPPANLLLHASIDNFASGPKNDAEWKALWPGTKWANGPDEGRLAVTDEIAYGGSGKAIRVLYPQGGQQSGGSGAQWFVDLNGEYDDLYMSYWVRFDEDFDFVLGGKMPGLGGANSFIDRTHEWSGRLMWREGGKVEFYVHVPAENNFDPGDRFWWNTEGFQATLVPGRWHHIELHMKLNNPGQYDGLMEGWFDGVKAASYPGFYFRDAPTATAQIAWVFFSTFFGGSSSSIWQATKDEHATFDEIKVATDRLGYPGIPVDVDADGLPNIWEIDYFGDAMLAQRNVDSDGDGCSNFFEYIAGTHPLLASDVFTPKISHSPGVPMALSFQGKSGRSYQVFYKQRLTDQNWTPSTEIAPLTEDAPMQVGLPTFPSQGYYKFGVSKAP
jgi:hypothetical protein